MARTFKKFRKNQKRLTRKRGSVTSARSPKFIKVDAEKDIGSLEKMLRKSPITIVMVYLGWCGHCQKAKPNFMEVAKKNHPGVSFALLNGDLQDKTSLKSVKVEGVPEFVVNANINGQLQSTKVPISYEKEAIERLANASVATANELPATMAISNKTPADLLASVKRNNAGNVKLNKNIAGPVTVASDEALPIPDTEVSMPESLMFDEEFGEENKGSKKASLASTKVMPAEINEAPLMINSLNPMSATSPIATLLNMSKKTEEPMKGGAANIQPRQDPNHPGHFVVNIPGKKTVRGKYSTVAKAIRKYEGLE
jgi:thiol-disulfide isomerase/thioredoxin